MNPSLCNLISTHDLEECTIPTLGNSNTPGINFQAVCEFVLFSLPLGNFIVWKETGTGKFRVCCYVCVIQWRPGYWKKEWKRWKKDEKREKNFSLSTYVFSLNCFTKKKKARKLKFYVFPLHLSQATNCRRTQLWQPSKSYPGLGHSFD